jgi:hypothetical protein
LSGENVTFHEEDVQNDPQTVVQLQQIRQIANMLENELAACNRSLGLDRKYLQKVS